jgi:hypothetical protein
MDPDPDPGGPTYGSSGSGSATLASELQNHEGSGLINMIHIKTGPYPASFADQKKILFNFLKGLKKIICC